MSGPGMNMQSGDANRQYLPPEQDEEEEFEVSMKGDVQGRVLAKHIWKLCMLLQGLPRLPANAFQTQKKAMKVVKKLIALQQKFEGIAQVKAAGRSRSSSTGSPRCSWDNRQWSVPRAVA